MLCKLLILLMTLSVQCYGMEDLLEGDFYDCIKCLCHSVTNCHSRINCGQYSINQEYWRDAGSPTMQSDSRLNIATKFQNCMRDENCIVNTIKKYTDPRMKDCNCDGKIDCKDRLAVHLFMDRGCINPYFGEIRVARFNRCAQKIGVELMEIEEAECQ